MRQEFKKCEVSKVMFSMLLLHLKIEILQSKPVILQIIYVFIYFYCFPVLKGHTVKMLKCKEGYHFVSDPGGKLKM